MSLLKSLAESGILQPVNKGRYAKYKKKPSNSNTLECDKMC